MKTTKKEILDVALTVFSEKGYEGAFLRDISASLGITKPALYKHFESKEALWNAMIASVEQYYRESFAADGADNTLEVGVVSVGTHLDFFAIHFVGDTVVKNIAENKWESGDGSMITILFKNIHRTAS